MNLFLNYDTYTYKTIVEGVKLKDPLVQKIENNKHKPITYWLEEFLNNQDGILEEYNIDETDPLKLTIRSTKQILFSVRAIIDKINKEHEGMLISFSHKLVEDDFSHDKIIKALYGNKFNSLPDEVINNLKERFDEIKEDLKIKEVPIVVVAPMSSGKSTFINALIGKEILPHDQEATTATICNIIDNKKINGFKATSYMDDQEIEKSENADYDFIKKLNENANQADKKGGLEICIEGNIKNLSLPNTSFKLIDTPGPNSASNSHHKNVFYKNLNNSNENPFFIYVLNTDDLGTESDAELLENISKKINSDKDGLSDRVLFVLNKADNLDFDNKPLKERVGGQEKFLSKLGFTNPKIFPVSALFASLAQAKNEALTRKQKNELSNFKNNFFEDKTDNYKGINFTDAAEIPNELKKEINDTSISELDKILMRSGIKAVTKYIESYIENNHKVNIVNKNLNRIIKLIELEKDKFEKKYTTTLKEKEKAICRLSRDAKKFESLKDKLKNISKQEIPPRLLDKYSNKLLNQIGNIAVYAKKKYPEELNTSEYSILIKRSKEKLSNIVPNETSNLESAINTFYQNEIENRKQKIKELIGNEFQDKFSKTINTITINTVNKLDTNKLLSKTPLSAQAKTKTTETTKKVKYTRPAKLWGMKLFYDVEDYRYETKTSTKKIYKLNDIIIKLNKIKSNIKKELEVYKKEKIVITETQINENWDNAVTIVNNEIANKLGLLIEEINKTKVDSKQSEEENSLQLKKLNSFYKLFKSNTEVKKNKKQKTTILQD